MDRDPILDHLAQRFAPPPDALGGVIERRRRRTRNRRIAGASVGLFVAVALIAVLVEFPPRSSVPPSSLPAAGPSPFGDTGLRIAIPPSWSTITDALTYWRYIDHNGGWGMLGDTACGWASHGPGDEARSIEQFAGAAYLDTTRGPSEPERRLLVLRTPSDLQTLVECEIRVRLNRGARLLQRSDVQIDGRPAVRLTFRGGSYSAGRAQLLYLVNGVAFRWAFDFTIAGVQAGAFHQFDSMMLLSLRLPDAS